ncbi:MAG: hypothetical protein ACXWLR_04535, partial [Myxococcales bacterium]
MWPAIALAAAAVVSTPRVATAFRTWEATQRQATILAARTALSNGADGLPELSALLNEAEADANEGNEADDAQIRRLVMAA